MSVNDPLGDLLSRIRNAQMRNKSKVSTPGSKMRARVLEVLKNEGYIRGYSSVEHKDGRSEFEIELKYFDGAQRRGSPRAPRCIQLPVPQVHPQAVGVRRREKLRLR